MPFKEFVIIDCIVAKRGLGDYGVKLDSRQNAAVKHTSTSPLVFRDQVSLPCREVSSSRTIRVENTVSENTAFDRLSLSPKKLM